MVPSTEHIWPVWIGQAAVFINQIILKLEINIIIMNLVSNPVQRKGEIELKKIFRGGEKTEIESWKNTTTYEISYFSMPAKLVVSLLRFHGIFQYLDITAHFVKGTKGKFTRPRNAISRYWYIKKDGS